MTGPRNVPENELRGTERHDGAWFDIWNRASGTGPALDWRPLESEMRATWSLRGSRTEGMRRAWLAVGWQDELANIDFS